jgi:hypothetical protein
MSLLAIALCLCVESTSLFNARQKKKVTGVQEVFCELGLRVLDGEILPVCWRGEDAKVALRLCKHRTRVLSIL